MNQQQVIAWWRFRAAHHARAAYTFANLGDNEAAQCQAWAADDCIERADAIQHAIDQGNLT